jgi:hypothetical protein
MSRILASNLNGSVRRSLRSVHQTNILASVASRRSISLERLLPFNRLNEESSPESSLSYVLYNRRLWRVYIRLVSYLHSAAIIGDVELVRYTSKVIDMLPKHYSGVKSERIARSLGALLQSISSRAPSRVVRFTPQAICKLVANVPGNSLPGLLCNLWTLGNQVGEHACTLAARRLSIVGRVGDAFQLIRCLPYVQNKELAMRTIALMLQMREHWKADLPMKVILAELSRLSLNANVSMYNSLISAAINCNNHELIHRTYHTLLLSGLEPDKVTFSLLIKYHKRVGNVMEEKNILQWCVKSQGSLPSTVAFAIIQALYNEKKSYQALRYAYQSLYSTSVPDPFTLFDLDVQNKLSIDQAKPVKILLISYFRSLGSNEAVVEQFIRKLLTEGCFLNNIAKSDLVEALIIVLRYQPGVSGKVVLLTQWLNSQSLSYKEKLKTKNAWEMTISVLLAYGDSVGAERVLHRLIKQDLAPSVRTWHLLVSHYFASRPQGSRTVADLLQRLCLLGLERKTAFSILTSYMTAVDHAIK